MQTMHKSPSGARLAKLVSKTVVQATLNSHVVVLIDESGVVQDAYQNRYFAMDVISVVGPGLVDGVMFDRSLLLEIGMRRSKPYASVRVQNSHGHRLETLRPDDIGRCVISERSKLKGKFLKGQLYQLVSQLDRVIHQIVSERVSAWKTHTREVLINRKTHRSIIFEVGPRMSFDLSDGIAGIIMVSDLKYRDRHRKEGSPLFARAIGFKNALSGAGEISAESIDAELKIRRRNDRVLLSKSLERISGHHCRYPLHPHTVTIFESHLEEIGALSEFRMVADYLQLIDRPLVAKVDELMRQSEGVMWPSDLVGLGIRRTDNKRVVVEFTSLREDFGRIPALRRVGWQDEDIPF